MKTFICLDRGVFCSSESDRNSETNWHRLKIGDGSRHRKPKTRKLKTRKTSFLPNFFAIFLAGHRFKIQRKRPFKRIFFGTQQTNVVQWLCVCFSTKRPTFECWHKQFTFSCLVQQQLDSKLNRRMSISQYYEAWPYFLILFRLIYLPEGGSNPGRQGEERECSRCALSNNLGPFQSITF